MRKLLVSLILISSSAFAVDNGFWTEGKDHPQDRVNVGLKSVAPDSYIKVAERVDAAVVNISTTQMPKAPRVHNLPRRGQMPNQPNVPPFLDDFFGNDLFQQFFNQFPAPQAQPRKSLGSGFIINGDGYIVTNNHVIDQADEIKVILKDDSQYKAKVVGRDPKTDVALIQIETGKKLPHVVLGDSNDLKVGEMVVAIGNPFGLSHTVTHGIVSAKERSIGFGNYDDFIQTDASINPGNSGGPLANMYGEVIGINAAIVSSGQGLGFAIPINLAKDIALKLKNHGKVVRGWLGVVIQELDDEQVRALGLPNRKGALVADAQKGGPAEKAGIKSGDVIVKLDGREVADRNSLPLLVANTPVGKKVSVDLIRDGKPMKVEVQIAELKGDEVAQDEPSNEKSDRLGLQVTELQESIAQSMGLGKEIKGVLVSDIDEGSSAFERGLRSGDVILEVDRKKVVSVAEYKRAVASKKKGDSVLLLVKRPKNVTLFIAFTL